MSTCQSCTHWLLRDSSGKQLPMARHGFGPCELLRTPWTTFPPTHQCGKHKEAAADVVAARVVWLNKQTPTSTTRKAGSGGK